MKREYDMHNEYLQVRSCVLQEGMEKVLLSTGTDRDLMVS